MNLKLVTITSLLVGTAFASNTASPVATGSIALADAIQSAYSTAKADPEVWKKRTEAAPQFDYKLMDDVKGAQPFCSLNSDKGDEESFNKIVENLRMETAKKTDESIDFKNLQVQQKIKYIYDHAEFALQDKNIIKLIKDEGPYQLDSDVFQQYIRDEILAFKIALSSYEAKTKNFKEIRAVMEALHGIFRFNLKADEFVRVIVDALKDEKISEKAKKLHEAIAFFEISEGDDTITALRKYDRTTSKDKDVDYKKAFEAAKKLVDGPLIIKALHKAHDKTSSPVYLGAYASSMIIVAFAILFWKHSILVKKESQEFDD